MYLKVDAKALEWYAVVYLSQDKVGIQEILDGADQHTSNQQAFGLPSRLIAKKFVFRLIYGGEAFTYAHDADFTMVSRDPKFWQRVIDRFYAKYTGIAETHTRWVQEATRTGRVSVPTGRLYYFQPELIRGEYTWPKTKIINYPVQGLGADLMTIARVSLKKRWNLTGKLVNTVHDDIEADIEPHEVQPALKIVDGVWRDIPKNFEKLFKVPFNLPLRYEAFVGKNLLDMNEIKLV